MDLVLRPPRLDDEAACLEAHAEFDGWPFLLFWRADMTWVDYVAFLDDLPHTPPASELLVRSAFLLVEADGALVGRTSLRFELNEELAREGGHVGYGVRPTYRRRGYATEILRQSLELLRAEGVGRVLVCCDDSNTASARVIEHNGGALESVISPLDGDVPRRRYWID
jgi:predicted acetyltransferase